MSAYVDYGYVTSGYIRLDSDTQGNYTFDGHGKFIFVSQAAASVSIADMYSKWVNWLAIDDNSKWGMAVRYSGYDPIPGGYSGAIFFLTNGWKVVFNPNTTAISGVLYSEDYATAYWGYSGLPIFPVQVSALVNNVIVTQNIVTGDLGSVPSAIQNATAVWGYTQ